MRLKTKQQMAVFLNGERERAKVTFYTPITRHIATFKSVPEKLKGSVICAQM